MVVIAALAVVAILSLLAVLDGQQRSHQEAQAQWAGERRELLNRIQRPEMVPVAPRVGFEVPEVETDEWAQVGQIDIDPKWLTAEDDDG